MTPTTAAEKTSPSPRCRKCGCALRIPDAGLFLAYLDAPDVTVEEIDADGWFSTGDTASRTEEGCILLVVVLSGTRKPALAELCEYLLEHGLSKHFPPERVEYVDELPKTPSGRIRKVELRGRYAHA